MDDPGAGAARRRVCLLTACLTAGSAAILAQAPADGTASPALVALVVALFVIGELVPLDIELRRDTHTFTFTSAPFVLGLFFLPPGVLVAARVLSSVVSLGLVRRQPVFKLATNLACHLGEVAVAAVIVGGAGPEALQSPWGWLLAIGAVVAGDLFSALGVTAAISAYQGRFDRSLLGGVWFGIVAVVADASVAVLAISLFAAHQAGAVLVVVIAGFLVAVTRAYAQIRSRYRNVELLYEFTHGLGESVLAGDVVQRLLERAAEILHAELAWLVATHPADGVRRLRDAGGWVAEEPARPLDHLLVTAVGNRGAVVVADRPELAGEGIDEVIAAPLLADEAGDLVLCVADRSGSVRGFDDGDCALLATLSRLGGVSVRSLRLLERVRRENQRNEYLATHDSLTKLGNRARFHQEVAAALRAGTCLAVLLIDLDRFKEVNDTLGHHNGDVLLVEVGRRLEAVLGDRHRLARLGGDEFAVMLDAAEAGAGELRAVADRIRTELERPFVVAGVEMDVGASVGVAETDPDGDDVDSMLRRADVAMYAAKGERSGVAVYRPEVDHYSRRRLALVPRFRSAIEREELELWYQPKVDLASGGVLGVEALLRWPTPEGHVPPDEFIPIAEHTGLIHPLTNFVLQEATAQCRRWQEAGLPLVPVAVNLAPRNLLEPDLVARIGDLLASKGLPGAALSVEVTESTIMSDPEGAVEVLGGLRAAGLGVSIDDFGTGYSSLAYLTRLPASEVKVDRSFVQSMGDDPGAAAVVRAVVDLASHLGLQVVAEGVETESAAAELRAMGCGAAQGYLFARPMPAAAFASWLADEQIDLFSAVAAGADASPNSGHDER